MQQEFNPHQKRSSNRRQYPRARVSMAVKERYHDHVMLAQASDISRDGLFMAWVEDGDPTRHPEAGSKCWVEFSLPTTSVRIRARCQVVRHFRYRRYRLTALHFAAIAPSHRRLIEHYVEAQGGHLPSPVFLPPIPYE